MKVARKIFISLSPGQLSNHGGAPNASTQQSGYVGARPEVWPRFLSVHLVATEAALGGLTGLPSVRREILRLDIQFVQCGQRKADGHPLAVVIGRTSSRERQLPVVARRGVHRWPERDRLHWHRRRRNTTQQCDQRDSGPPGADRSDRHPSRSYCLLLVRSQKAADTAFEALAARTARTILARLYEQPATPTALHDEIETSRQTVHYHLTTLEEAGLIEPAGTEYSEKGTEMTRYAPAKAAVVLIAGVDAEQHCIRDYFH